MSEPAFPVVRTDAMRYTGNVYSEGGLTKLEWFAGLAMQAYIQHGAFSNLWPNEDEVRAQASVRMAKAMLAELAKEET